MWMKLGWFLFLLTIFQVSARYKNVEPDFIKNEISQEPVEVSPSSSRIVSGWEALPGQHPHHASLRMVGANGGIRVCGGSIVAKEWVITSGFCTVSRILAVVRAGVVDLINPAYIFETTEWYIHPQYNNLTAVWTYSAYDISLVKLQRPVIYTELVKPIRIQSRADAYRNYAGEQVYASGHGRTSTNGPESDVLRWVYLRAISNTACRLVYRNGVFDTTICAQYFNVTSQNTCFGDNGGPLVHVGSDGVPTLIGVSYFFPTRGCESGLPTAYTRPGPFLPWLEEVMGIDTSPTSTTSTATNPTSTSTTTLRPTNPTTLTTTSTPAPTSTSPSSTTTNNSIPTTTIAPTSTNPSSTTSTKPTPTNTTTPESTDTTTPTSISTPESTDTTTPTSIPTPESTDTTTPTSITAPDSTDTTTPTNITTPESTDTTTPTSITAPDSTDTTTPTNITSPESTDTTTPAIITTPDSTDTTTPTSFTTTESTDTTTPTRTTTPEFTDTTKPTSITTPESTDTTTPTSITTPESTDTTTPTNITTPESTKPTSLTTNNPTSTTHTDTTPDATDLTSTTSELTSTTITTPTFTTPDTTNLTTTTSASTNPEDLPEETTTAKPEDKEEEEDSDSSESNEDDDLAQLLKRLQVDVKVKVRLSKYKVSKVVGNDISVWKP